MVGKRIGNFEILRKIGQGGMAEVFLAQHIVLGFHAAAKVILPHLSTDSDLVRRFFSEARIATIIDHPGIVRVFDASTLDDGRAYLIMEHLQGETWAAALARSLRNHAAWSARSSGIQRVRSGNRYGLEIAATLAAVHYHGVIHRDVKPANLFFSRQYREGDSPSSLRLRVRLLDFGVAKLARRLEGDASPTVGILGTAEFMAPEQWGDQKDVGPAADIYSLGCVLYQWVAGRPPFQPSSPAEACRLHLTATPPPLRESVPDAPETWAALLHDMLAKDPGVRPTAIGLIDRFQTGQAPLEQLAREIGEAALGAAPDPAPVADAAGVDPAMGDTLPRRD